MHKNRGTLEEVQLNFLLMHPEDFKSILSINVLINMTIIGREDQHPDIAKRVMRLRRSLHWRAQTSDKVNTTSLVSLSKDMQ